MSSSDRSSGRPADNIMTNKLIRSGPLRRSMRKASSQSCWNLKNKEIQFKRWKLMMETREDGKKQKAYVAITSSTSYFHSLSSCKRGGGGKEQERAKRREGGEGTRKRTPRTLRNTQRTVWRACILVRVWRVKASFYLLNSFVSLPLPKEITCTKWSVSTKGTLSRRTPNLLLKLPKIWPKSMWNNCNQNKNAVSKITV